MTDFELIIEDIIEDRKNHKITIYFDVIENGKVMYESVTLNADKMGIDLKKGLEYEKEMWRDLKKAYRKFGMDKNSIKDFVELSYYGN